MQSNTDRNVIFHLWSDDVARPTPLWSEADVIINSLWRQKQWNYRQSLL